MALDQTQKGPRRRRGGRLLLGFVLSIFALFLLLAWAVRTETAGRWLGWKGSAILTQRLGIPVDLQVIRLELIPFRVSFESLHVGPDKSPLLHLPSAIISIQTASLWQGRLLIPRVDLQTPTVWLREGREGWEIPKGNGGGGGGLGFVLIDEIRISDGTLHVLMPGERQATLSQIDLSLRPDLVRRRGDLNLTAGPGEWRQGDRHQVVDRIVLRVTGSEEKVQIQSAEMWMGESKITARGAVGPLHDPVVDAEITGRILTEEIALFSSPLPAEIAWQGRVSGSIPRLRLEGHAVIHPREEQGADLGVVRISGRFQRGEGWQAVLSGRILRGSLVAVARGADPMEGRRQFQGGIGFWGIDPVWPIDRAFSVSLPERNKWYAGGTIRLSGEDFDLPSLRGEGRIALTGPAMPAPTDPAKPLDWVGLMQSAEADFRMEAGALTTTSIDLRTLLGRVVGRGGLSVEEVSMDWELTIERLSAWREILQGMKPDGRLAARGRVSGPWERLSAEATVQGQDLSSHGVLWGNLEGRVRYAAPILTVEQMVLSDRASRYALSGGIRLEPSRVPEADLRLELSEATPGRILTALGRPAAIDLPVEGSVVFRGWMEKYSAEGSFLLGEGEILGQLLTRGEVRLAALPGELRFERFSFHAQQSSLEGSGSFGRQGLAFRLEGNLARAEDLRLLQDLSISGAARLSLSVEGFPSQPRVNGRLEFIEVKVADGSLGDGLLNVQTEGPDLVAHLDFEADRLAMVGRIALASPHPWQLTARTAEVQWAPFLMMGGAGDRTNVSLVGSSQIALKGEAGKWERLSGEMVLPRWVVSLEGITLTNPQPIRLLLDQGRVSFPSFSLTGEDGELHLTGEAYLFDRLDLAIQGKIGLPILTLFLPRIRVETGEATFTLRITERWRSPVIRGELQVQQVLMDLPPLQAPIVVESVVMLFRGTEIFLEELEGRLQTGRFLVSGRARLTPEGLGPFRVIVELFHLPLKPNPRMEMTVSSQILMEGDGVLQAIRGDVQLEEAIYREKLSVGLLLTRLAPAAKAVPTPTPYIGEARLDVTVFGSEGIRLETNLAEMPLLVDLALRGSYDHPVLVGRVEALNGVVMAQRRRLEVLSGSVDFANVQRTEPTFALLARTAVRGYEIQLGLSGKPEQIDLSLTSTPPLPESDILALLTVGKTTAELAGGGEGLQSSQAASFVLETLFEGKVEEVLRVDRFEIGPYEGRTGSGSGARITVEKRVYDDRLSVIFSTNISTNEEQLIRLEYRITPNISLILDRDELGQIGGDVKLTYPFR